MSGMSRAVGGYWMLLHPLFGPGEDNGQYRVVFGSPEPRDRATPVSIEEVAQAVTAVHGPDTRVGRVLTASRFTDATRQLENYRHGRVLFAGDAAHIHAPIGGQGLNLGVQDAMNLGWKLAATVRGTAPSGLLDTYQAERHPVAARVLTLTKAQRLVMTLAPDNHDVWAMRDVLTDLLKVPEANRHLAAIMSGLDIRYDLGSDEPLVGQRVPDADIRVDGQDTRVSALLHAGNWLLLDLAEQPTIALPAQVRHVVASGDLRADRLLIRPDGYIASIGSPDLGRWFA
jgi:hypothetical protein